MTLGQLYLAEGCSHQQLVHLLADRGLIVAHLSLRKALQRLEHHPPKSDKILIALRIDNLVKDSDIDGPSLLTLRLITYGVSMATIS